MRLIDADKVNETIDKFIGYLDEDMILRIKMKISAIPTVERPHGGWIPCSERLPEEIGYYLVSDMYGSVYSTCFDYLRDYLKKVKMCFGYYDDDGYFIEDDTVVAWLPLPEPYKEGGDPK